MKSILVSILIILFGTISIGARAMYDSEPFTAGKASASAPNVDARIHNINKVGVVVSNQGSFGTGFIGDFNDPLTGGRAPSGIYPYPGQNKYLFAGSFWVGSVVGRDTLVSVGADGWFLIREMWPDQYPGGGIEEHSINDPDDEEALSEQDFIAVYTDTVTNPNYASIDPRDGRPHIPLNIEITQRSYAWSYAYAEDFILFDYSIKNIGRKRLEDVYMSIYLDAECRRMSGGSEEFQDDVSGFRRYQDSPFGCGFIDTINIAWVADNDGRHNTTESCPNLFEMTSVEGIKVVRTPSDSLRYSFNWWVSNGDASLDFGPRKLCHPSYELGGEEDCTYRDFGGFLGTPEGDLNKYYLMRTEEFDYDQLFTAADHTAEGWLPPPSNAVNLADGYDTRFLLSFGPFEIEPGEVLPVSFAYVFGENFHHDCEAFENLFVPHPSDPQAYYDQLDFSDLASNAIWASWIYDNPGYDTDGDGNFGKFRVCNLDSELVIDTLEIDPELVTDTSWDFTKADTNWYEGDGVPDFRGAAPPPAPKMWIYPRVAEANSGELVVRFNGLYSETDKDIFSQEVDFEGYKVYLSLSTLAADFNLLTSYDRPNVNKYYYNPDLNLWQLNDPPFSFDEIRALYPGIEDPNQPVEFYYYQDSILRFIPMGWNRSDLTDTMNIHKRFPDEPPPTVLNPDTAAVYYPGELTDDGYFKYYEYEYTIRNLLPSQLYYIAVTAFDYGSPKSGLESLETNPRNNMIAEYPQYNNSLVAENDLDVVVYPNPYRIDGNYRGLGFEGRGQEDMVDDRVRAIHFTNLPPKCTIRIFTIDGDLVREIKHDYPADSPQSMHDIWDVITRNTQAPASGIYYWTVESPTRTQMGKLVLIM